MGAGSSFFHKGAQQESCVVPPNVFLCWHLGLQNHNRYTPKDLDGGELGGVLRWRLPPDVSHVDFYRVTLAPRMVRVFVDDEDEDMGNVSSNASGPNASNITPFNVSERLGPRDLWFWRPGKELELCRVPSNASGDAMKSLQLRSGRVSLRTGVLQHCRVHEQSTNTLSPSSNRNHTPRGALRSVTSSDGAM